MNNKAFRPWYWIKKN